MVCGTTRSFGIPRCNVYLIKTDSEGDTLWTRVYYPWYSYWNEGYSCQQTRDGGYVAVGFSISQTTGEMDFYLITTDADGDTIWARTYDEGDLDWGFSVRQTYDGGYIVSGFTNTSGSGSGNDVYLIKTNSEGDTLWTKTFGGSDGDVGYDVQQTSDSNYIVVGATGSCGAGSSDLFLVKISSSAEAIVRGDVTRDGDLNICDVIYLINYLFKDAPLPEPLLAGDTNCDGTLELEDVIYLIDFLFKGGPEPGCECG